MSLLVCVHTMEVEGTSDVWYQCSSKCLLMCAEESHTVNHPFYALSLSLSQQTQI